MDIFFGLVAGIVVAFALFNKPIQIRIKHEYDKPEVVPQPEYDVADEKKALEDAQDVIKKSTAAYNELMNMFSGIEVSENE